MILTQLRTATAEDHRRAEALMPSLDDLATPGGYAWSLCALHGFFLAWEPPLLAALASFATPLSLDDRRKLPLLASDLAALQIEAAASVCASPPLATLTVPAALGAMYVLEGSTLGGQVIERHVAAGLAVTPLHGGAFYHGYGLDTGMRWRAFGGVVESYVRQHGGDAGIIDGARACFGALETWLARQQTYRIAPSRRLLVG